MDSNKPVILPAERDVNRQACIILAIFGSLFCVLFIVFGLLIWKLVPVFYSAFSSLVSPKALPVSEHERFQFPLFSIGAPDGSGWTYMPLKKGISFEHQETLGKRKTGANAWSVALETTTNYSKKQFLEYACAYPIHPPKADQYTEQQKDCDWWEKSSFDCVRLYALYIENKDSPSSSPLILDNYTLACRHPDFYNAVIFLDYSEQGPAASMDENVSQQADVFFNGMGMNFPQGTPPAVFEYETTQEIQTSEPGTNLAYRKPVKVSRELIGFPAGMAVDGMDSNWWSAGARPPQWIEIDLGANYVIREVQLLTSQSPDGRTIHQVLARGVATGDEFLLVHTFDGVTSNSQSLISTLPEVLRGVRYIRIETTYTPSWVGWREIKVIAGE
jgi:F5/8 type C domain-containing protein